MNFHLDSDAAELIHWYLLDVLPRVTTVRQAEPSIELQQLIEADDFARLLNIWTATFQLIGIVKIWSGESETIGWPFNQRTGTEPINSTDFPRLADPLGCGVYSVCNSPYDRFIACVQHQ